MICLYKWKGLIKELNFRQRQRKCFTAMYSENLE